MQPRNVSGKMQEQKKLLTIVYCTTNGVDREAPLYRRIMAAKLKHEDDFDIQLQMQDISTKIVKDILSSCDSKYILFLDDKPDISLNYIKTIIEYLSTRTLYLAEPYMYVGAIPTDPSKTELNNRYFYSRDTDIFGAAFNTRRLADLLEAIDDIDKSGIYLSYRLYWGLSTLKPIQAGYSVANNTKAVIGVNLNLQARRLFPQIDTKSIELRIYMLRFLAVYLRGLRTHGESGISAKHLFEIVQKYQLHRITSLLGPMQQFEVAWIDWLSAPSNSDILFKQLTNEDAYLNFQISRTAISDTAIYSIKLQSEYLHISRQYKNRTIRPDFDDPSVYDFYSRPVTPESTIIFYDRPMQADDNAEYLYSYLMDHHPEFENCYFALNPKSADWERLENRGFKLVKFFSPEFYELFLKSDAVVSSQIFNLSYKGKTLKNSRSIYLQHGIQLNDMSDWIHSKQFDLFVATGKPEADYISSCAPVETLNSGLPRLATLKRRNTGQRQILFMPTWRFNLNTVSHEQFVQSDYFNAINQIMTDTRILKYLSQNNISMQVKLHPNIANRTNLFNFSQNVVNCEMSYREAISSSEFALTDFSSVVLDAAFVDIPIAYYQWDASTFFDEQPYENRLDYVTDGLGPVFYEADDIITYLSHGEYVDTDPIYFERKKRFFEGVEQSKINSKIIDRILAL